MRRRHLAVLAGIASALLACPQGVSADETEVERLFALPLEELINIYVTSPSQTSRPIRNAANSVTSVSAAQIRAMGARTLSDVLKMLPATQILNRRNGLDSVLIRGIPTGRNSKVLLLIDGVPHQEVIFGEWSPDEQVPLVNIDRIEIIRGPGSALYGSNAYAGIISIYTRDQVPSSSRVVAAVGDFATRQAQFSTGTSVGDGRWLSSGSFYKTDGYPMQADRYGDPTTHDNNVEAYNLHFKALFDHWRASLTLNQYSTEYPLYPSEEYKQQDYTFIDGNITRHQQWGDATLESQLYLYNVTREFDHRIRRADDALDFYSTSDLDTTLFGFRNQVSYAYAPDQTLVAGVLLERQHIDHYDETAFIDQGAPDTYLISVIDRDGDRAPDSNNYALYMQQESSLYDDALILTGGLRSDHFDRLESRVSPRLGVTYNAQARGQGNWSTKLLWGRAFRKPTLLEQYEVRSDNNAPGNPDLNPEDIETTEAEFTYLFSTETYASATVFRSKLLDFIQTIDRQPYQNNPDTVVIPGFSLEWNSRFRYDWGWPGELGLHANYTHLDTDLASVARKNANLMVFVENQGMGFYVGANYLGRRNATDAYHSLVENLPARSRDNNHGYLVLDAAIRWKNLASTRWELDLTVHNLLDKEHYNPETEPENYYDMTKEPRQIRLGASYEF